MFSSIPTVDVRQMAASFSRLVSAIAEVERRNEDAEFRDRIYGRQLLNEIKKETGMHVVIDAPGLVKR
jgi:hypothetical protein